MDMGANPSSICCLIMSITILICIVANEYGVFGYKYYNQIDCLVVESCTHETNCSDRGDDFISSCFFPEWKVTYNTVNDSTLQEKLFYQKIKGEENKESTKAQKIVNEYQVGHKYPCLYKETNPKIVKWMPKKFQGSVIWVIIIVILYVLMSTLGTYYDLRESCDCNPIKETYYNIKHRTEDECIVCMDNLKTVLLNCGHHLYCYRCAQQAYIEKEKCPICQKQITKIKTGVSSYNDYINSSKTELDSLV